MARKVSGPKVDRRKFLAGVAVAGAAASAVTPTANAGAAAAQAQAPALGAAAIGASRSPPRPERRRSWRSAHAPGRLRLHGRRHQVARHRISAVEPGLELPRPARVADQLRRQQEAGIPHLHSRGNRRRHGARLLQGHRQAADDAGARHGRPAARRDGGLQRLVRPRAGHRRRRQPPRSLEAPAGRADLPLGAGHQCAGARLHQVGRHAGLAPALRAVVRARLQDRDDAALRAGRDRARRRPAAGADQGQRREARRFRATCRPRRRKAIPAR